MAKPGPKPKSTFLKLAEGTREDRVNREAPVPPDDAVFAPRELSGGALRHWNRLFPTLVSRKIVTAWDAEILCRYCEWTDRYEQVSEILDSGGFLVNGRMEGSTVKNPAWQLLRDSSDQITRLGALLGLNPSDRSRIKAGESDSDPNGPERLLS